MADLDDTVPPSTGLILVQPFRDNFRATKGKINDLPDALDPGGNQCTPLLGRVVVIGAAGARVAQQSDVVSFGLAYVRGVRLYRIVVTNNTTLTDEHSGAMVYVDSGTDVVLTVSGLGVSDGWYCRVLRAGTGEVAIAVSGGLTLRHPDNHTRIYARYDEIELKRVGTSELWLAGRTKP